MLLGASAFLLVAVISALAFLRVAYEDVAALEDLEQVRDSLLKQASHDAAHLNEIAINQSLVLWHLGAALRAQLEFAEGGLLHAATAPFYETTVLETRYPPDAAFSTFRNALSVRSSRHLHGATELLARNRAILEDLEKARPGFLATLDPWPVGEAWCAVAARWGKGPALAFPGFSLLTRALAGSDHFTFDENNCTFQLTSAHRGALPSQSDSWARYEQEVAGTGGGRVPLYLPNVSLRVERKNSLTRTAFAKRAQLRVSVTAEHPKDGEPESLLVPNWAAFPIDISYED